MIEQLAQQRLALERRGQVLVAAWRQRFPKGTLPFGLVRLGGESNTLLRWRCSGADCHPRGCRLELDQRPDRLAAIAPAVRSRIFDFERERTNLNCEFALTAYAHARLLDLERHRQTLVRLRRTAGSKPAEGPRN